MTGTGIMIASVFTVLIVISSAGLLVSVGRADARMGALIDSSLDLVMIVDAGGGVRYHSPGMSQMLGFESEVQLGTPVDPPTAPR